MEEEEERRREEIERGAGGARDRRAKAELDRRTLIVDDNCTGVVSGIFSLSVWLGVPDRELSQVTVSNNRGYDTRQKGCQWSEFGCYDVRHG